MALAGLENKDLKVIIFGGKGGVGKTSCAIATAIPTGHALRLISSPKLLDEWIKVAAKMRWKYRYMITSFSGSYQQDEVDAFLFSLKKMLKRIENILMDQNKCEFIPVCIPEAMAILETDRLLSDLSKTEIYAKQIIVNNVMISDECDFCKRRKAGQFTYIQEISEKFNNLNIVLIPLFAEEIKGSATLNQLKMHLFEDKPVNQ
ncbi:MAG: ArsA family ATPase [Bacteroidales bacterium]|nr:ArsA family ATPase [Bacteroidales bacterium]